MKGEEAVKILENLAVKSEEWPELAHIEADQVLLDLIGSPRIEDAFHKVVKGYGLNESPDFNKHQFEYEGENKC